LFVGIKGKIIAFTVHFFPRFYIFYCHPCTGCPQKNFRLSERYRKDTRCTTAIIFTANDEVSQFAANDRAVTNFENQIWRRQESRIGGQCAFHTEPPWRFDFVGCFSSTPEPHHFFIRHSSDCNLD